MSLEIIYGPYLDDADKLIFSNIKSNLKDGKKVLYIVPEQSSFDADKNIVEALGEKFSHLTQTINFKRLSEIVNQTYSKEKHNFITEEIKDLVLFGIVKKYASDLKSLKGRSKGPDSILIFKDIMTELKTHLADHTLLKDKKEGFSNTPALYDKISDLSLIMEKYDEYLKNKFSGYEDMFSLLTKNINEHKLFKDYEIYIDGFVHFSPSEFEIIKALFKNCLNMHITLLLDSPEAKEKTDLFYIPSQTFLKLKKMAQEADKSFLCTYADEKTNKTLLKVFKDEDKKVNESIIATDCKNYSDEIRNVIYKIKEKTHLGYRYSDICILTGSPDIYDAYVEKLLTASQIPFFMDKKVPLSKNPVCKFFVNVLNAVQENFHYEDIACYIKSILFMFGDFDEITVFETYISNFRIKKNIFINKSEWDKVYEIIKPQNKFLLSNEKSIFKTYDRFITPLCESFSDLKKKNKAQAYTTAIKRFIKALSFETLFRSFIDSLSDFNEKQLYINAYNTFIMGVRHIEEIIGEEEIDIGEYTALISQMLEIYKIGALPNTVDSVTISDLERGRTKEKKLVFIIGLNDGITPKTATDTSYLSDIEREEFERICGIELPSSKWKNSSSLLALYRGCISPKETLYISKSLNNADDEPASPSFVWQDLKESAKQYSFFKKDFVNISEASQYVIQNRYNPFADKKNIQRLEEETKKYRGDIFEEITKMQSEGYYKADKKLSKQLVDSLYQKKLNTSVSRIESYQKCSYSYFLRYLLKVNTPDKPDYDFAKTGTIIHNVLDDFSKKMNEEKIEWNDISGEYINNLVEKLVISQIKTSFPESNIFSTKTKYLIKKLTRTAKTAIYYIKEHYTSGLFTPIGYEIPINEDGVQPLSFLLSDGSVMEIYGRVDRADIFAGENDTVFVRIIDYKSKSKSVDFALVKEGIRIQLLVYLQTLVKNGGKYLNLDKLLLPGAAFYMAFDHNLLRFDKKPAEDEIAETLKNNFLLKGVILNDESVLYAIDKELEDNPNYKSQIAEGMSTKSDGNINLKPLLYKEQFALLLDDCENILKKTGEQILNGDFNIRPYRSSDKTACDYCDYKGICQFDKTVHTYKTTYSLTKDKYFEMRGEENNG